MLALPPPPPTQTLAPTRFEANWFEAPGCGKPAGPNTDRTIVSGEQALCHRVPNAPTAQGFRVVCTPEGGSGFIQFCADATCGQCDVTTAFNSEQVREEAAYEPCPHAH